MKRLLASCVVSAALGGIIGAWSMSDHTRNLAYAQVSQDQPDTTLLNDVDPPRVRSLPQTAQPTPSDIADASLTEFTPEERTNIRVYENTNRGVVHITTKVYSPEMFLSLDGPSDGAGSGAVLDKNGHILTNYHVIEGATSIQVTLFNGETYEAGLVGRDPVSDIAVLRINAPADVLQPIELGDSSKLKVGQKALAIGNPFGLERTLTVGSISSLNRRVPTPDRQMKSMIQIDAALNRGNSGGPLINTRSQLIGMNTAILSPTGQNIGVGFALPVNTIRRIVPQLIEKGRVIRAVIGIPSVHETDQGLVIIAVTPGGPAERAGLRGFRVVRKQERRGPFIIEQPLIDRSYADTVVAVDGQPMRKGEQFQEMIELKQPGDRIELTILRDGREAIVPVVLGASE